VVPPELTLCENGREMQYSLTAVANHIGTLDYGHYTALGRRGVKWFLFNDSRVSFRAPQEDGSESAYILFYTREGDDDAAEEGT